MANEYKEIDKDLFKTNSNELKAGVVIDIQNRKTPIKEVKMYLPENIYVERKGQLVKINEVQLFWSSFRQEYKLVPSNIVGRDL